MDKYFDINADLNKEVPFEKIGFPHYVISVEYDGDDRKSYFSTDLDVYSDLYELDDISVLHRIIEKWGRQTQINKIQEECLELSLVLNQMNCPTKDPKDMEDQLYDELADAKILLAQANILFDEKRIIERIRHKLDKVQRKYLNS